jgi:recombination protein RecA
MAKKSEKDEREEVLSVALGDITKRFGEGAVMRLGEATHLEVESIPTGSLPLDLALGIGGIPRGRVTEIFGPEASGKTTLCQHIVAEAQKLGGVTAFIDMEHALDPAYAARCGVDIDNLYISQPDTGEQALEITETLVRSGAIDVVVVDSVAALVPRSEIEGDMGDPTMGMQARLMSQALRKLSGAIKQTNTSVIFTNQLRMKIGVMFGNPETTTGGRALKFYASVRVDVRRTESIKVGQEVVGNRVRARIVKNKVAAPFKVAEFDIMYNEGISRVGGILDLGVENDLIVKRGSFYSYKEDRLGQGRENTKEFLREHPEMLEELDHKIRVQAGLLEADSADETPDPEIAEDKATVPIMDDSSESMATSKAAAKNGNSQKELAA